LKRCSLILRPCPSRGGENTKSHYIIEVIKCPALSGYPGKTRPAEACGKTSEKEFPEENETT
jgi:hypothetical protein